MGKKGRRGEPSQEQIATEIFGPPADSDRICRERKAAKLRKIKQLAKQLGTGISSFKELVKSAIGRGRADGLLRGIEHNNRNLQQERQNNSTQQFRSPYRLATRRGATAQSQVTRPGQREIPRKLKLEEKKRQPSRGMGR